MWEIFKVYIGYQHDDEDDVSVVEKKDSGADEVKNVYFIKDRIVVREMKKEDIERVDKKTVGNVF